MLLMLMTTVLGSSQRALINLLPHHLLSSQARFSASSKSFRLHQQPAAVVLSSQAQFSQSLKSSLHHPLPLIVVRCMAVQLGWHSLKATTISSCCMLESAVFIIYSSIWTSALGCVLHKFAAAGSIWLSSNVW